MNNQRSSSRVKKRQQYVRNACNQCKKRKVKCTGESCCRQCATHRVRCIYGRVTTSSPGSSSQASSRYEGLEEGLLHLQSSLDQVLQQMRGSSLHHKNPDLELDALLLETMQKIETCRSALSAKNLPRPDDISDSQLLEWDLFATSPPFMPDEALMRNQITSEYTPPFPFSKNQALELIEYFHFEAECFYPFIPFDSLKSLVGAIFESPNGVPDLATGTKSEDWGDMNDSRNVDMLNLLLACAVASRSKKETGTSRRLMSMASEKVAKRLDGPMIDTKDIAIVALLSVYHLQCDETPLAWRKISMVANLCRELGLHKSVYGQPQWVSRMFWCIYVLDKRFSFMVNLPFTLQDSEIEHTVPEYDNPLRYISSLIKYVRIAARFVPTMPKLGSIYIELELSTRTSIDIEADQWALSTATISTFPHAKDLSIYSTKADSDQYHKSFITVCRNQLKISLYKHNLFSLSSIAQNSALSHKAVSIASETIDSCSQLQKSTAMYHLQAVHFNFFVLSAVAALYLAVRHAPLEFSDTPREIFTGLEILRPYCTSVRLCERVQALEKAMRMLGYDGMGIGPQLSLNQSQETLYTPEGGCGEETDENEGMMAFIPQLGSFSSLQSQAQAELCNDGSWMDISTPSPHTWHAWENQEWIV